MSTCKKVPIILRILLELTWNFAFRSVRLIISCDTIVVNLSHHFWRSRIACPSSFKFWKRTYSKASGTSTVRTSAIQLENFSFLIRGDAAPRSRWDQRHVQNALSASYTSTIHIRVVYIDYDIALFYVRTTNFLNFVFRSGLTLTNSSLEFFRVGVSKARTIPIVRIFQFPPTLKNLTSKSYTYRIYNKCDSNSEFLVFDTQHFQEEGFFLFCAVSRNRSWIYCRLEKYAGKKRLLVLDLSELYS